jgi:hypothetical protein
MTVRNFGEPGPWASGGTANVPPDHASALRHRPCSHGGGLSLLPKDPEALPRGSRHPQ